MIILVIFVLIICIACKTKFNGEAYFNTVNFGTLFIGFFIYGFQLIAFCIMNAQMFSSNIRAVVFTLLLCFVANYVYTWILAWPAGIQYVLILLCPFFGVRSLFQVYI